MSNGPSRRRLIDWLAVDAWIDATLWGIWNSFKDRWSGYSSFFHRFKLTGPWKVMNEAASEGFTLSVVGFAVVLSFAIPAFQETSDSWRSAGEFSVTVLDRYGNEIGKRGILHSDAVPLEDIPDHMIKATLATEDRRFFEHFGIDVMGTLRALVANAQADAVVQGGSSITQQLAKNLFLSSERSLDRKVKELFLAFWLETHLTKREILKLYLDRAYMGGGAFGAEAAAQFYFGKSVREVNLPEAAMLAGLFKAPARYAPHINLPAARARANEVLTNMVQAGYLTEGQVYGARVNPAAVVERGDYYSPDWFLDYAFEEVQRIMKGKGEFVLTVRTTVDIPLQKAAEQSVEATLRQEGRVRRAKQAALVSMEPDGAVRALVGGRDYGESQFNRATHAYRQPGSSFKTYVYLTALQDKRFKSPNTMVVDGPVGCGRWSPKNYSGGYRGRMTMTQALAKSVNTIAVKLSLQVGREKVLDNLIKMGITNVRKSCSMALGDTGMTPLQHTGGYANFASGGVKVTPYAIEEIQNSRGELLYSRERDEPKAEQIFDRKVVETLNQMLEHVITEGTGKAAALDFTHAVGKTGTSSNYRDAWFIGFTGQYVTGVWFGNDDFTPMGNVTGGSLPAQTWKAYNVIAHGSANIPPVPGLPLTPMQIAEQQRIAALRKEESIETPLPAQSTSAMPQETRTALEKIAGMLREAKPLAPAESAPAAAPPTGGLRQGRFVPALPSDGDAKPAALAPLGDDAPISRFVRQQ